ncbi:MAG: hypothetical protein ABIQ35_12640, partial [Verrucomicrobiota bacterium]
IAGSFTGWTVPPPLFSRFLIVSNGLKAALVRDGLAANFLCGEQPLSFDSNHDRKICHRYGH